MLIIQNDVGNRHSPTVICAAITSKMNKAKLPTHVELDPDAFLRQYAEIPGRLKPDSREHLVACAYLADGYAAKGDLDAALAALSPLERAGLAGDAALRGLYLQDLCAYRLGKGDRAGAAQALEELEGLAAGCGEKQARLAQNLSGPAALLRARLTCLRGRAVDRAAARNSSNVTSGFT